jgi:hypothetical protein
VAIDLKRAFPTIIRRIAKGDVPRQLQSLAGQEQGRIIDYGKSAKWNRYGDGSTCGVTASRHSILFQLFILDWSARAGRYNVRTVDSSITKSG